MLHKCVAIKTGKYAGLVGVVEAMGKSKAQVRIEGVSNGEPIKVKVWLNLKQLEVVNG